MDAEAVRIRAAKALLGRSVRIFPHHVVGLSEWVAVLPAHESALCKAAVEEHAAALVGEDPDLCMDQARADALVDLVLARVQVTTTVELGIPVQTLTTGLPVDQMPTDEDGVVAGPSWQQVCAMGYEIAGVGVIPGDVVAGICARFGTRVRRVLLDEATGTTAETGSTGYQPPAGVRRFVTTRDGHCRAPGCARAARYCDLDHVIALAGRPDEGREPAHAVPATSPDEAPDPLAGGDDPRRGLHLDRPLRPGVHDAPGRPLPARCLSRSNVVAGRTAPGW